MIADAGYRFDNGPTVLTMPDLIADAFDCVGEDMADWLTLRPIDPLYRAWYADGSSLDVKADPAAMTDEIRRVCGPEEAAGYERYVEFVTQLYRYEMTDFIDRNIDSPFDLLTPNLARLAAIGGFRRMAPKVEQYLKDPRTQRVLSFQAMYAGMSPFDALALYCVIAYMDSVAGVFAPDGGMHAVPEAMAAAAQQARRRHPLRHRGRSTSNVAVLGRSPSTPPTASGSPATPSSSTPTCPWPCATCWARNRGRCAGSATRPPAS